MKRLAKSNGYDDIILLDKYGYIMEGTTFGVGWVKNKIFYSPDPKTSGILKSITLKIIIECCNELNIQVVLGQFFKENLLNADEVFMMASSRGLMPIRQVNNNHFPEDGEITKIISNNYLSYVSTNI